MAGLPPTNHGQQQQQQQVAPPPPPPCLYNDPSVYVKTEYDQGKLRQRIVSGAVYVDLERQQTRKFRTLNNLKLPEP